MTNQKIIKIKQLSGTINCSHPVKESLDSEDNYPKFQCLFCEYRYKAILEKINLESQIN